jgi:divalent metal cation (Fe/Co/Zn/Cd) transporter
LSRIACGYLAVVVVVGLVAQLLFGTWWIDSVTSLVIVGFLMKEGREAWFGGNADDEVGR